ncbi:MAG TPA: NAD-dependent epimerase/dehydratase family protein [Steroidobacteraceae bacterium]|nr:NAD-dependent epimerase/dehydratase family protein [Steroidobacteraceae bacterium]
MRILASGASGFIGSHFVERALADGHQVVGLYRAESAANCRLLAQLHSLGAKLRIGDLLDVQSLREALVGVDVVCHFAAAFNESAADDGIYQRANVTGTANLAGVAAELGIRRFVHCSTAGIYGRRADGILDEESPMQPWNAYERSKLDAESALRRIARSTRMEYVILRPAVVYGPRDARLRKMFSLVARGRFPLFGRGAGHRHFIHVADAVDAFMRACTEPAAADREMIIAGPKAVPLRELLYTLASVVDRPSPGPQLPLRPMLILAAVTEDVCRLLRVQPPLHRRRMDFYLNDAEFDCRRARHILGWEPKVELRDGLARTWRSYLEDVGSKPGWPQPAVSARAPSPHR